jgi:hypothetical protein
MTRDRYSPVRRQAIPRRDVGLSPRSAAARSGIARRPGTSRSDSTGALGAMALLVALIAVPLLIFAALSAPGGTPRSSPAAAEASSGASGSGGAGTPPATGAGSTGTPGSSAAPETQVPIVPVVSFWSTTTSISRANLVAALEGRSTRYRRVIVPATDRDAIATRLGVQIASAVRTGTVAEIRAAVRRGDLGLMRASDVSPSVRALAIGNTNLFGNKRTASLETWPLLVPAIGVRPEQIDPGKTWTLVAAGDILLDRGVARQVKVLGKGVDFPYDGGTAEITGYTCCSGFGHRVPTYRRTGDRGAMREMLKDADLAMANLESPVDDEFVYHTIDTVFSGDPKLLDGIQRAGIDFLSLGNNHIGDAGSDGVLETVAELDRRRIAHSGAGKNFAAARKPAVLRAKGTAVAVLGCDAIASTYWTSGNGVGSRACGRQMTTDIQAAAKQADVVVVYPHWGAEYRPGLTPNALQRGWAKEWVAAGADVIIGNHAHWAGPIERINGKLAFYALGNFVFDQMWQEQTMEGLVLELTFQGRTLKQAWLHPTLIIDQSQPNFMDPAGDGARVLTQVREASQGLLPY